jgi:hypothetical protein
VGSFRLVKSGQLHIVLGYKMKNTIRLLCVVALLTMTGNSALSQGFEGMAKASASFGVWLSRFCGQDVNFIADIDSTSPLRDGSVQIIRSKIEVLDGNFRQDLDATAMSVIPSNTALLMKQLHANQIVALARFDRKMIYLILPGVGAYRELPITDTNVEKAIELFKQTRFQQTPISTEFIDGHSCIKTEVQSTTDKNDKGIAWFADDLHGFPLKIEGGGMVMHFTRVNLAPPETNDFEVPADCVKVANSQEMMNYARKRFGTPTAGAPSP